MCTKKKTENDTIEAGQKFGFFQNASFIFPNKILTEVNSHSTRPWSKEEQRQNGILWNLCLMIDSFQSVTFSQNFIIVESGEYSHYNLPVLPKSVSEFQISNASLSDITSAVMESNDIKQLSLLENQQNCVRIHRWLIHFESLLAPNILYTDAELKQLLLNLHFTTLAHVPLPLAACFGQFTTKKSMSELSQSIPRFQSSLILACKVTLLLMASIHSLSIQMKMDLFLPLTKVGGVKYDLYTSSEIILICLRAFAYFLMIEADTAVDLQDHSLKMSVKIIEQSLSLMFCGEICRLSIKSNVPDIANQLEIVDIVKKKLFPRISGKGWEWKLAAYYAFKIQEYVS
ncbi:hypothetical protein HDV02_005265 [Globomyces sp. JEL0801]|nr:hypothetical protein HDV02_005265 [Globomyces sp. JEL0801]